MKLYNEAEQFIKDVYWGETHDKRSNLDIVKLVSERLLNGRNNESEYFQHREGVVHASSLARCLRGVVLEMLQAKPDKELDTRKLGIFKAGNLFEDFIIKTLGDRVIEYQREYTYKYKSITITGRSDCVMDDDGIRRVGEIKSVHSDSFWYRQKSGDLIAWNNQVQLQIYMWLERMINGNDWDGVFFYVSKDDCTVEGAPIRFNQNIIDEVVIPALDIINEAYEKRDATLAPVPDSVVFNKGKGQYQKNWLCTYCDFHNQCTSPNWILEAGNEVARKNKELKEGLGNMPHLQKKEKPIITATPL
jgi:hypothetical protein